MSEFLVRIAVEIPLSMSEQEVADIYAAEAVRGGELFAAGNLRRVWRIPGTRDNVGIWEAPDASVLHDLIASLPLFPYLRVEVQALAKHPGEEDHG